MDSLCRGGNLPPWCKRNRRQRDFDVLSGWSTHVQNVYDQWVEERVARLLYETSKEGCADMIKTVAELYAIMGLI